MELQMYWITSLCLSSLAMCRHFRSVLSHTCRSRSILVSSSTGGASTSTAQRQSLKGSPSPSFLKASSTSACCTVAHPLLFSRASMIRVCRQLSR
uniref:Putative secreted protein n=1 Tax=Ixodes ricinus TaxID=34613 RepID=A0A6B0U3A4_IXORI